MILLAIEDVTEREYYKNHLEELVEEQTPEIRKLKGIVGFPATTGEVSQVVQAAQRTGVDWVPRGSGTNLPNGTVLPGSGISASNTDPSRTIHTG